MADRNRTSRDIERELQQERAELRESLDDLVNRFTFEDAWNRVGAYMRDNSGAHGQTLARVIKEKPMAVALTAVGVAWLLFGPTQPSPNSARRHRPRNAGGRMSHDARRAILEAGDFGARSAQGPSGRNATTDPWEAPSRQPAAAVAHSGDGAAAGEQRTTHDATKAL